MSLTDRVRELKQLLGKLLPRTVSRSRKADEEPCHEVSEYGAAVRVEDFKAGNLMSSESCGVLISQTPIFECMNKGRCLLSECHMKASMLQSRPEKAFRISWRHLGPSNGSRCRGIRSSITPDRGHADPPKMAFRHVWPSYAAIDPGRGTYQ